MSDFEFEEFPWEDPAEDSEIDVSFDEELFREAIYRPHLTYVNQLGDDLADEYIRLKDWPTDLTIQSVLDVKNFYLRAVHASSDMIISNGGNLENLADFTHDLREARYGHLERNFSGRFKKIVTPKMAVMWDNIYRETINEDVGDKCWSDRELLEITRIYAVSSTVCFVKGELNYEWDRIMESGRVDYKAINNVFMRVAEEIEDNIL